MTFGFKVSKSKILSRHSINGYESKRPKPLPPNIFNSSLTGFDRTITYRLGIKYESDSLRFWTRKLVIGSTGGSLTEKNVRISVIIYKTLK